MSSSSERQTDHKEQTGRIKRNVRLATAVAVVLGAVVIGGSAIGLGRQDQGTTASDSGSGATAAGTTDSNTSTAAGNFPIVAYPASIAAIGAEEFDFSELLGAGTQVVLNFWAGQCPPCRAEMPAFQNVYDTYGDDFLLVGVDIGPFIGLGSRESAVALLGELDISYPTVYSVDARAMREFNVLGMPSTVFYDGDGIETGRQTGLLTEAALEARVRELLGLTG